MQLLIRLLMTDYSAFVVFVIGWRHAFRLAFRSGGSMAFLSYYCFMPPVYWMSGVESVFPYLYFGIGVPHLSDFMSWTFRWVYLIHHRLSPVSMLGSAQRGRPGEVRSTRFCGTASASVGAHPLVRMATSWGKPAYHALVHYISTLLIF